jgi:hypothetical protein
MDYFMHLLYTFSLYLVQKLIMMNSMILISFIAWSVILMKDILQFAPLLR